VADVVTLHRVSPGEATMPRLGSRADRMAMPLARNVLRALAEANNICVRPVLIRRTDTTTGQTEILEVPCGATLAAKCTPCAERHRRLRMQQIREGWHLTEEPVVPVEPPGTDVLVLVELRADLELDRVNAERAGYATAVAELDEAIEVVEEDLSGRRIRGSLTPKQKTTTPRRKRSTRRRADVVELPRLPIDAKTIGRVYVDRTGRPHVQSTLLTTTLPSYGDVHSANRRANRIQPCACGVLHAQDDTLIGTPVDPSTYDYRQAALDTICFPKVTDRFWQNLRRAAGWNVQYAGAVEMQRRLAPHGHFCMRGTLPRKLVRQVAAATYHQLWWPAFHTPLYSPTNAPQWDDNAAAYVDPTTGQPLTTWGHALDALDHPDAQPAYVARLGRIDVRGIEHGTKHAERAIRYTTKYLTKDLTEQVQATSDPQRAHLDRLHAELSVLPCSPRCANWLLYGVQPDQAKPGLIPGGCTGKVHQRKTLGFTGRRVLISRHWSGKTLADHRADNHAWVRTILAGALAEHETPDHDQHDDDQDQPQPVPATVQRGRYRYQLARPDDPDVLPLQRRILTAISARTQWRRQLDRALHPAPPGITAVSATPDQPAAQAA
jgi:replication initiator protein RepSA